MASGVISPEFIVDIKGKKKAVIIEYKEYEELMEDLEDLKDVDLRKKEPARSFTEYHKERIRKK